MVSTVNASIFGLAALALAGVAGASFAWPMKYVRGWRWEHVWVGQALTSNVIVPLFTLVLVWPLFRGYMAGVPAGRYATLFLMGVTWGLGGSAMG